MSKYEFNPFTGKLDNVGKIFRIGADLYYYYNGNRYRILSTLDNPGFLILEDGSYFLLEDGTSRIVMEN